MGNKWNRAQITKTEDAKEQIQMNGLVSAQP